MNMRTSKWTATAALLLVGLSACAGSSEQVERDEIRTKDDPRAYDIPKMQLDVVGQGWDKYEGVRLYVRVVDPMSNKTIEDSAAISAGNFTFTWPDTFEPDRVAYMVAYFVDVDGDGRCDPQSEPSWEAMAENRGFSDDGGVIRLELDAGAVRAGHICQSWSEAAPAEGETSE